MERGVHSAALFMARASTALLSSLALLCAGAASLAAPPARADTPKDLDPQAGDLAIMVPPPPILPPTPSAVRRELRYDLRWDIPIVIAGYVSWTTLEQLRPQLTSDQCRLCDEKLNAVDRGGRKLRWDHTGTAATISDITANALVPSASVGLSALLASRDGKFSNVPLDILFIAQATTFANGATLVAKYAFARSRPYARAARIGRSDDDDADLGDDANVSFYSGHTSYAFALAVSSGTVASLRGYRGAGYVWAAGLGLATATAYLRVAADQHYVTDVVGGAALGSAFGFLFPYLLHRPVTYGVPVVPSVTTAAGGGTFSLTGAF